MEEIGITSISSRGQVVIPQDIREKLCIREGDKFAIVGEDETIILKRIEMPSREKLICDLERIAKKGRIRAEKLGIREKDIPRLVHKSRGIKE
jgi:AbrB family looped-hinge helix DNA binding protein